ncbi:uncharacterized protein LOC108736820 isoform X1 [Agrilus planipennis]|uniref:Kinase n=2 Tax=Agrilus planipennis TaxID=224129 RepID=A0A7F5R9G3_AGRPL|nr:uncharacterized protein LOC108736820 isoform X1 [Agrilus planipennis]
MTFNFSLFWTHQNLEKVGLSSPWCINGEIVSDPCVSPPNFLLSDTRAVKFNKYFQRKRYKEGTFIGSGLIFSTETVTALSFEMEKSSKREHEIIDEFEKIKEIIRSKAQKHSTFYRKLYSESNIVLPSGSQMTYTAQKETGYVVEPVSENINEECENALEGARPLTADQRGTSLEKMNESTKSESIFKSVKQMREKYMAMLESTYKKLQEPLLIKGKIIENNALVTKVDTTTKPVIVDAVSKSNSEQDHKETEESLVEFQQQIEVNDGNKDTANLDDSHKTSNVTSLENSDNTEISSAEYQLQKHTNETEKTAIHTQLDNDSKPFVKCSVLLNNPEDNVIDSSKTDEADTILSTLRETQSISPDRSATDDSYLAPPTSGYCSSAASGTSEDERDRTWLTPEKNLLQRSSSNDSALNFNLSDDEHNKEKVDEELAGPTETANQEFCTTEEENSVGFSSQAGVPSKTLIEGNVIMYPLNRQASVSVSDSVECSDKAVDNGRRHSCATDDDVDEPRDEQSRYRYFRTPSVVVSDYSDDVTGLTLDDIEFFKNQRIDPSSSAESSLNSSCSNLNYCGSSIIGLDSDIIWKSPFRKNSASSCSEDEDGRTVNKPSGWRKLRNIVQWTPFFQTYKKQRYPWVQLAGHQGNFKAGPDQGTVLKKLSIKEEKCFKVLMNDVLKPYVPEYKGQVTSDDGESSYIQLQDLLGDFVNPCVMDCKIGVRTYLEEELAKAKEKPKLRKDMYEKMIQIDPNAPSDEEHRLKAVTKPRYMIWRETISSTATLGFRIEGIRKSDGTSTKDFKTTKTKDQIINAFHEFTEGFPHAVPKYIQRLKAIKATLQASNFFNTHEVIGSSLLFVHDRYNANVWLIDFAKTLLLPSNVNIDHNSFWKIGNHEDGYMIGINNIISIFVTMLEQHPVCVTPPPPVCIQENKEKQRSIDQGSNEE